MNSSEAYEKIFLENRIPQPMDILRWEQLFSKYKGGKLIDLGCLHSLIPLWAKKQYPEAEVWGLDQAEKAIKELAEAEPDIHYTHGDACDTGFPNNYFDYVVAGELIEHLEDPKAFFKEVFRILKPGGVLALTTPKEETEAGEVDQFRHLWSYSKRDLEALVAPYVRKAKIGSIPSWVRRRIKYHHPYLIMWATKK